jgi:hypothetical protein
LRQFTCIRTLSAPNVGTDIRRRPSRAIEQRSPFTNRWAIRNIRRLMALLETF